MASKIHILTVCIKEIFRPSTLLRVWRYIRINGRMAYGTTVGMGTTITDSDIGENCFIGNHCNIKSTRIGRRSYVNEKSRIVNATIGAFVSIGADVQIGIGRHPIDMVSTHPAFYSNNKSFETFANQTYVEEYCHTDIGNDVWIGSRSCIMGNIRIGDGAIVAYGAVVTKDVPPYAIVGGVPAKVLKYRFSDDIIKRLTQIKWWEFQDEFLKERYKIMHNPDTLIWYYDENKNDVGKYK